MKNFGAMRRRLDRLAARQGPEDDPPDPDNPSALVAWAVRRYGLEAMVAGSYRDSSPEGDDQGSS